MRRIDWYKSAVQLLVRTSSMQILARLTELKRMANVEETARNIGDQDLLGRRNDYVLGLVQDMLHQAYDPAHVCNEHTSAHSHGSISRFGIALPCENPDESLFTMRSGPCQTGSTVSNYKRISPLLPYSPSCIITKGKLPSLKRSEARPTLIRVD